MVCWLWTKVEIAVFARVEEKEVGDYKDSEDDSPGSKDFYHHLCIKIIRKIKPRNGFSIGQSI